jgi:cytochrome c biogenesis protein CcdA
MFPRLLGLVISIGLADSLNPSTIAPALYLASGDRARRRVAEFTVGVFAVYFLGGVLVALGPGQLLLSLVPRPHREAREIIETIAGVAMLGAAALLWRARDKLSDHNLPEPTNARKSSALLGATITALELPTAFPYFAAIAAIVGSGFKPLHQVMLLLLFNLCFVLPLLGIALTLTFGGRHADQLLGSGRDFLQRHWPAVLAGLALVAGVFIIVLGATGLASRGHGRVGRFFRHFRRVLHLHS